MDDELLSPGPLAVEFTLFCKFEKTATSLSVKLLGRGFYLPAVSHVLLHMTKNRPILTKQMQ